jgi:hypothetical protein
MSCQRAIADQLLPALHDDFEGVLGPDQARGGSWLLSLSDDDRDRQTLLFAYPAGATDGAPAYIRPMISPNGGESPKIISFIFS